MAYTVPVVAYSTSLSGTYTALTGIQSVHISRGRRRFQDPFSQTTCVVELIPANSYATPLEVGQFIDVRVTNSGSAKAWFNGRISDVERTYEFPYNSGTGAAPADRITITAMGGVAAVGQAGNAVVIGAATADARENMVNLLSGIGVYMNTAFGTGADDVYNKFDVSTTIAAGSSQSYLDLVNYLANAGQAFVDDVDVGRAILLSASFEINAYKSSTRSWTFSDNPGAGEYKYTGLAYLSGALETFNEITVAGYDTSLTKQTANAGIGAPYNELQYQTQLNSTANMSNLAAYLLTTQNETEPTPFVIRTNTLVADGIETKCYMAKTGATDWFDQLLGAAVTLEFRGSTVTGIVQGASLAFYAESANFEFYLSPFLGAAFTLDSTTRGVLDTNRLGYP